MTYQPTQTEIWEQNDCRSPYLPKQYLPASQRTCDADLLLYWLQRHPHASKLSQIPVKHRQLNENDFHTVDGDLRYWMHPVKAQVKLGNRDLTYDYSYLSYEPSIGGFCLKGERTDKIGEVLSTIPFHQIEKIELL